LTRFKKFTEKGPNCIPFSKFEIKLRLKKLKDQLDILDENKDQKSNYTFTKLTTRSI